MAHPATYLRPESLSEAIVLAADPTNLVMAGGTWLQPLINEDAISPRAILDISAAPELRGNSVHEGRARIGATATLAEIGSHPELRRLAPILSQAIEAIACPEVRLQATLGGNIEAGLPSMDSLPALLVLDAEIELASASGRRRLALRDHLAAGRTTRAAGELLVGIDITFLGQSVGRFVKLGPRKAFTPSILSLALLLRQEPGGEIGELRVAAGCCADRALRLPDTEAEAAGRRLDDLTIDELGTLAAAEVSPSSDLFRSAAYRRHALEELLRRTLRELRRPN